jgi:hypothetical protein
LFQESARAAHKHDGGTTLTPRRPD